MVPPFLCCLLVQDRKKILEKKIKGLLTDQWYATITNLQAHNALVPPAV